MPRLGLPSSEKETQTGISIEAILTASRIPCITFQNIAEFWSTAGRPVEQNGLAMTVNDIYKQVEQFEELFEILPDRTEAFEIWKRLCIQHQVRGRRVHDVRLVATALSNGVFEVLTHNIKDFCQFEELSIFNPDLKTTTF